MVKLTNDKPVESLLLGQFAEISKESKITNEILMVLLDRIGNLNDKIDNQNEQKTEDVKKEKDETEKEEKSEKRKDKKEEESFRIAFLSKLKTGLKETSQQSVELMRVGVSRASETVTGTVSDIGNTVQSGISEATGGSVLVDKVSDLTKQSVDGIKNGLVLIGTKLFSGNRKREKSGEKRNSILTKILSTLRGNQVEKVSERATSSKKKGDGGSILSRIIGSVIGFITPIFTMFAGSMTKTTGLIAGFGSNMIKIGALLLNPFKMVGNLFKGITAAGSKLIKFLPALGQGVMKLLPLLGKLGGAVALLYGSFKLGEKLGEFTANTVDKVSKQWDSFFGPSEEEKLAQRRRGLEAHKDKRERETGYRPTTQVDDQGNFYTPSAPFIAERVKQPGEILPISNNKSQDLQEPKTQINNLRETIKKMDGVSKPQLIQPPQMNNVTQVDNSSSTKNTFYTEATRNNNNSFKNYINKWSY